MSIVAKSAVLDEFDRIKARSFEASDLEICTLVAAQMGLPPEAVQEVVEARDEVQA